MNNLKNLIFVDCEANGKCPSMGKLTEFGAFTKVKNSIAVHAGLSRELKMKMVRTLLGGKV